MFHTPTKIRQNQLHQQIITFGWISVLWLGTQCCFYRVLTVHVTLLFFLLNLSFRFIRTRKPSIMIQNRTLTAFRNTKAIISAPLYFPIHHNHSHMDPSIMVAAQALQFLRTIYAVLQNTEHTALASGVASVHLNSQPGERHPQWTECCRLVPINALRPVVFWKWQCIWCAPSNPLAWLYMPLCRSWVLPGVTLSRGESSPDISKNLRLMSGCF